MKINVETVIFDDWVFDDWVNFTIWFAAPVELLDGSYPKAVAAEIMVEFEDESYSPLGARVQISPTFEDAEGLHDTDWKNFPLSNREIEILLSKVPVHPR